MNVYDFDQTVFYPDSSYCFLMYCLRHETGAVLRALPGMGLAGLRCLMKKADTKALKEKVFAFLPALEEPDRVVAAFWEKNRGRLESWYLRQKRGDDLIISASPEFLLRPIARELGVGLIATDMDERTGKIRGNNCHDWEKVRRFREAYPEARVEEFYSDSLSDAPMAALAERAYLVKRGTLTPWPID